MEMVKFGADSILSSKEGIITDEDIDTLLTRGEEKTNEMNSKLSTEVQYSLANFSVAMEDCTEINMFTFEGENFKGGTKNNNGKKKKSSLDINENSLMISLPQRERKKNYDENETYLEDPSLAALVSFFFSFYLKYKFIMNYF